jgi:hypothetical protein
VLQTLEVSIEGGLGITEVKHQNLILPLIQASSTLGL